MIELPSTSLNQHLHTANCAWPSAGGKTATNITEGNEEGGTASIMSKQLH